MGRRLLQLALSLTAPAALLLTTYAHLPFNRPYYERFGFVLPDPHQRVAMAARLQAV